MPRYLDLAFGSDHLGAWANWHGDPWLHIGVAGLANGSLIFAMPGSGSACTLAMQQLAAREHVALIDLNDRSMRWIRALGEQGARPYFLFVPEQNKADGTHFSAAGANAVACLMLREAVQVLPTLQPALVRDIDCDVMGTGQGGDPARPSQVVHEDTLARAQARPKLCRTRSIFELEDMRGGGKQY